MNRRNFLKTIPVATAFASTLTSTLTAKTEEIMPDDSRHTYYDYYVNCYIQNQKYWLLEEVQPHEWMFEKMKRKNNIVRQLFLR